jgi:hypothetical protein
MHLSELSGCAGTHRSGKRPPPFTLPTKGRLVSALESDALW